MNIPTKIYEKLPMIYVFFGAFIAMGMNNNIIGQFGGMLMVATGVLVYHIRMDSRSK